jgi:Tfp pilus assembly protein PilF
MESPPFVTDWSFSRMWKLLAAAGVLSASVSAEAEQSLALVVEASGAQLIRAGNRLPVSARAGDLIFEGDRLNGGTVRLVACRPVPFTGSTSAIQSDLLSPCALPAIDRDLGGMRLEEPLVDEEVQPENAFLRKPFAAAVVEAELAAASDPERAYRLYRTIRRDHPDAREIASQRLFVLEAEVAKKKRAPAATVLEGKTLALLVGISDFENAQVRPLRYAHEDALAFERFLRSPRGGAVPAENIVTLINRQATTAAIKAAFDSLVERSHPGDTVILLLATHGAVVDSPRSKSRGAYIVSYDSDPEDLGSTAVPMARVQMLLREELQSAGRVIALVDACRSGTIGTIPNKSKIKIAAALDALTQTEGQLFLFAASRPGEVSFEGRQYGGGHGAFSFFVLSALNGAADFDSDGKVTLNEMSSYVQQKVAEATLDKQHPREGGTLDANVRLADMTRPGIELGGYRPDAKDAKDDVTRSISTPASRPDILGLREAVDLDRALAEGRLLPDQPENAFTALRQLKQSRTMTRAQILERERALRVALENRNQQVLVRYLRGDERPQSVAEYLDAARTISAAIQINGETPDLLSRLLLCEGRIAMFEKRFAEAQRSLELALRLDASSAPIYNALGTAYFEQGDFERALLAFDDAIVRAPYWIYPRNSRALAYAELGAYDSAQAAFDEALRIAPASASLHHNRAWLMQRVGQTDEAKRGFRQAAKLNPSLAPPWNALGVLEAGSGHAKAAIAAYTQAIALSPDFAEARENLARLLAGRGEPEKAIQLREENLSRQPDFLESALALAETYRQEGRGGDARKVARAALGYHPDSLPLLLLNARLAADAGDAAEAERLLNQTPVAMRDSLEFLECQGDLFARQGRAEDARAAWAGALRIAENVDEENRLKRRLRARP